MVAFRRSAVGQWMARHGVTVALLVAMALVAVVAPTGFAGAQATPVDPTIANINDAVQEIALYQYITAGLFLGLILFLGLRLLRAKRA